MPAAIPAIVAAATSSLLGATALGATVLFGTVTVASVLSAGASLVVGSALARRQQRKANEAARQQAISSLRDVQAVVRTASQPINVVYGRALVGGAITCWFTRGDVGQFHHWAQTLAGHRIDAVEAYYLNDDLVTVDASGWVTTPKYCAGGTRPLVRIRAYLGDQTTLDSELVTASAGGFTSADAGLGVAYLYVKFEADYDVFGQTGVPTIRALVRGARVYDPRTSTTAWSDNAVLCARDYLTATYGLRCTSAEINDVDVVAAANICDEAVTLSGGGTQARYTCNGSLSTAANLRDNLELLVDAAAGLAVWSQGKWRLLAGAYQMPVRDIGVDDIITVEDLVAYTPRRELFNTVSGTFVDPANLYAEKQFPTYTNETYVSQDSGQTIERAMTLPLCNDAERAQRMAKIEIERARQAVTVSLLCKWTVYDLTPGDHVTVTVARYGWAAKTFFVASRHLTADGIRYVLRETAAAVWEWDAGSATVIDLAPNTSLPDPYAVPPVGSLAASSGTSELLLGSDGSVASRILVSWGAITAQNVLAGGRVEIQYRRSTDTDWTSTRADGDQVATYLTGVQDGQAYRIRARAVTSLGQRGVWSPELVHTVVGKTEPPEAFDSFLVLVQPDGTRQFNFRYIGTPKPADWAGAEIRYLRGSHASPTWADMQPLSDTLTYYTASPVESNQVLQGVHTFACRSRDTSGNLSPMVLREITLPARRLGNVAGEWDAAADGWPGTLTGGFIVAGTNTLEAADSTTWATLPATWAEWTRWNIDPDTLQYTTGVHDLGVVINGTLAVELQGSGTQTIELRTSADNVTWGAWGEPSGAFQARYFELRITVEPGGTVPTVTALRYQVGAAVTTEAINDLDITTLGAGYLGPGDFRVPLANAYSVISYLSVTIQSDTGGTWSWHLMDKSLSGPRVQIRLNGALANPDFTDVYLEGY